MTNDKLAKGYSFLAITILFLICLGGAVRAFNAGLACPDWPLCFGDVIPDFHPQVYLEFIHRAVAGIEAIVSFYLAYHVFKSDLSKSIKRMVGFSLLVLITQVIMGGLTVLKLLQSGIVLMHLGLALVFFSSLLWIKFSLQEKEQISYSPAIYRNSLKLLLVVFLQILLGGWVASNYAGLACLDFPTCNGNWFPPLDGIVGIQMIHRFGAYFTFTVAVLYFFLTNYWVKNSKSSILHWKLAKWIVSLLMVQVAIGIANIKFQIPALLTVLHLAVASVILACSLKLVFISRHRS